jgi:hypothetical protein
MKTLKAIKELPIDYFSSLKYPLYYESRCHLCNSDFRERIEHQYYEAGQNTNITKSFIKEYFDIDVCWKSINRHMQEHCDLKHNNNDYLIHICTGE